MAEQINTDFKFLQHKKVLITGGAGYIGSHLVNRLLSLNLQVNVIDNLETGFILPFQSENLKFFKIDLRNYDSVQNHFQQNQYDYIFHLAGSLNVAESVVRPLYYYENNILSLINILKVLPLNHKTQFIFSSTSSVYSSEPPFKPFTEKSAVLPLNPYGESKLACENILKNYCQSNVHFSALALRFFNVAGAADNGRIGQKTSKPYHIVHRAALAALGRINDLVIHGKDFPTLDGTCIRDFLHIEDLIDALILSAEYLTTFSNPSKSWNVLNCGYQIETSVLQVIQTMQQVTGQKMSYQFGPRRSGDPTYLVASNQLIKQTLGWVPQRANLKEICSSAYSWEKSQSFSATPQTWTN